MTISIVPAFPVAMRTLLIPMFDFMFDFNCPRSVIKDYGDFQFVRVVLSVSCSVGEDSWVYSGLEDDGK